MRVLMTGATGLIGKEIGKRLIENGHTVTALVRDVDDARRSLPFPAKIFKWDVGDAVTDEMMTGIEGIMNLAGAPIAGGRWTPERKKSILDSRVVGTRELVNAAVRKNIKVFVSGSAVGIYGNRDDETLDEDSTRGEGFLADVAAAWEAELQPLEATKTRAAMIRTAVVFSRHGGALEKLFPLFEKGVAGHLGRGQQWMSWIHVDDISRLFIFALENEAARGPINDTAPEPVRNDRFTVEMARALEKPVFLPVPETALKLALGEMSTTILDSQRVLPRRAQDIGFQFQFPHLKDAIEEITKPLRGNQHELLSEQWLPKEPKEIFPYYCDERNLEELTPPFLKFKVLGKSTEMIAEGTLIEYSLSLHGVPFRWCTRIENWKPNESFVDTQLKGPYRKWYHVHEFIPFGGGTLIRDRVTYKLPLGFFGDMLAGWKVSRDVAEIFSYRRKVIDQKFNEKI